MKQIFLLLFSFASSFSFAQQNQLVRNNQGFVEATEVVQVDSFPAAQLYLNAQLFLDHAFQNVRHTAQIKDGKAKMVATKASIPIVIRTANDEDIRAKTYFTLVIQAKDGFYRYSIRDFYFGYTEDSGVTSYASFNDRLGVAMAPKQWQQAETQTNDFVESFVEDLKEAMLQKDIVCKEMMHNDKIKNGK